MTKQDRKTSRTFLLVALSAILVSACEVTNPGPVQDEFLNDATTHDGLVRGAERGLLQSTMRVFFASANVTREIFPGGDINSHSPRLQFGALPSDEMDEYWDPTQLARFIAEDAIRRFESPDVTADPEIAAQAYIWAGYANKILGETFCEIVIDGGPAEAPMVALTRAEAHFTTAIANAVTADQRAAAYAGRAQTRIELGDWGGAIGDAGNVPDDFRLEIAADPAIVATRNFIAWANFNQNYRQYSYHYTFFFDDLGNGFGTDYYSTYGDPRIRYTTDPDFPFANASLQGFGTVPWSFDPDFPLDAPMVLATGAEMRLYEAENILLTNPGNFAGAMTLINNVRAQLTSDSDGQPLDPWPTATSAAEAGTYLKNERLIEGHLRGRRLMDLRRWGGVPGVGNATRDNTPGNYFWPDWGQLTGSFDAEPTALCFPIPDSERDINPNVP